MFFIVCSHFSVHGASHNLHNIKDISDALNINFIFIQSLSSAGNLGVNFFILISGYFLCTSKFKTIRPIRILTKTWLYSLIILASAYLYGIDIPIKNVIKTLTPFSYWFINSFLLLLLLSPILNRIIKSLTKNELITTIIIGYILYNIPVLNNEMASLSLFSLLYMTGAYIRIYDISISSYKLIVIIILSTLAILLSITSIRYLSSFNSTFYYPTQTNIHPSYYP